MPRANSKFIREQRKRLGMSQLELSVQAEVAPRTVQFAESGEDRNLSNRTLRAIASVFGVEYEDVVYLEGDGQINGEFSGDKRDAFQDWPWSLSDFIQGTAGPDQHAFCQSNTDARAAIQSMRQSWKEHLDRSEEAGDQSDFAKADEQLNREYAQYEERYLSIWRANQNAILFSTIDQTRSGVCVVLPVTKTAYADVRWGKASFMDIEATAVVPQSQYLILDSAVEIPCDNSSKWYEVTNSLSFALFYQIALLSKNPVATGFRMLGFGASPTNLARLGGIGFSPCGVEMPEYGFQVCEFGLESDKQSIDGAKRALTTLHYANMFKIFSLTSVTLGEKQRMIRRALRLYQRIAKKYANTDQDHSAA
ncbi:MAG: helix-turn-helix transcriptional regulator [Planctomycetaceae bacterium]|nr:helix-turn-helix transcriptional regulator [Planctomycetaceae bacterium]